MRQINSKTVIILLFLSGLSYFFLGYFTKQDYFSLNFGLYTLAFISFIGFVALSESLSFKVMMISTVLLHGIFVISVPTLSPDIYRFLWDGELITQGIHPYSYTPNKLVESGRIEMTPYLSQLYTNITELSKANYSLYPTVNQFYFVIPAWLSNNLLVSIVIMRVLMLVTLFFGLYFIRKTLIILKISEKRLFIFALNPLVIVEATGNLHFEVVMFSFLAIAFYFILQQKWMLGALLFACAVNIKLTPLLLLPFFLNYLGWIKSTKFYLATLLTSGLLLVVFLWPSVVQNFMQSITLYFNNFEFNSSAYRLTSALFQPLLTYDTSLIIGPLLSKIALGIIVFLALFSLRKQKESLFAFMLMGYVVYLLFASTVHPWYLIIPLGISVFTHYNFMIYWSFIVMISYAFYALTEIVWINTLITLEYLGLILFTALELKRKTNTPNIFKI